MYTKKEMPILTCDKNIFVHTFILDVQVDIIKCMKTDLCTP